MYGARQATQQNKNFVEFEGRLCLVPSYMEQFEESPQLLRDFSTYHETIQGHSQKTVDEYFLDLRMFFRFIKLERSLVPRDTEFEQIPIADLDLALVRSVTLTDVYSFMNFLSRSRGLGAAARARKIATIRSFYRYLTSKAKLITENPVQDLDSPHLKKSLPKYLTLEQSIQLLQTVDGDNRERDYCILMLFLNCGLRISELVNLNLKDIQGDQIRVLGKGNKERILFLNESCNQALEDWLAARTSLISADQNALFITRKHTRITVAGVHYMVKQRLLKAGMDSTQYSSHKLRHTAATLMLQNGVDVRTLQEVLGHENLNTTQIYTHVSSDNLRLAAKANPLGNVKKKR